MYQIESLEHLVEALSKLQGVGKKTARRYAYNILNMENDVALDIANAIVDAKESIHFCSQCGNYTEDDICHICKTRDKSVICVVAEPKDIIAIEQSGVFSGVYHVLNGLLNPMLGKGPKSLRIDELMKRLDGVHEIIMATNATPEGNATAQFIADMLQDSDIVVTRLAQGISVGADIEYLDEYTMQIALGKRTEVK